MINIISYVSNAEHCDKGQSLDFYGVEGGGGDNFGPDFFL